MTSRAHRSSSAGARGGRPYLWLLLVGLVWLPCRSAAAQDAVPQAAPAQAPRSCTLSGTAVAGTTRLPGVAIIVSRGGSAPSHTSSTVDGRFSVEIPGPGAYNVKADLAGFGAVEVSVTVDDGCAGTVALTMTLASRVTPPAASAQTGAPGASPAGTASPSARPAPAAPGASAPPPPAAGARPAAGQARRPQGAGFQTLAPMGDPTAAEPAASGSTETFDREAAAQLSLPPGFSLESSADSVTAAGSSAQMNAMLLFGMMGEGPGGHEGTPGGEPGAEPLPGDVQPGGSAMGPAGLFGGSGDMGRPGGRGGSGGAAMGGSGGGGPGGGMPRIGFGGRMANRPRGTLSYTLGGSALNAAPYALTGRATTEQAFVQQRINASIGGPMKIPGLFDWSRTTNFFLNYSGNHSDRPVGSYATVPTAAMRTGDFSSSSATIIDPMTGVPFGGNIIPANRVSPTARALLALIPQANLDGTRQNFHFASTAATHTDDINLRLMRSFGNTTPQQGRQAARGMGGGRGMGGRGTMLSVGLHYTHAQSDQVLSFPTTGGTTRRTGWDIPVSLNMSRWGVMNAMRAQFNRNRSMTTNLFAGVRDVAGESGLQGVSQDAFDWGAPNLTFSSITGLRDVAPSERVDRTLTFGDTMTKLAGRHTVRWGGDLRLMTTDSRTNTNPRGTFVFTGLYTSGGATTTGTGLDVADFLLGLGQQATIQYGPGLVEFRETAWSLFVQDDWRVRGNLTLNAGLRYEYLSPYHEADDQFVTLDVAPGFSAAVPVIAGGTGPFAGTFSRTIVNPDRNNLAPRVGLAWKPASNTTIRGGYGISYSSPVYFSMAQRMAGQPPFAVTDTRAGTLAAPLAMATVFTTANPVTTTNNFAVDPDYQLGWVQIWNLDAQRDLTRTIALGVGYTGTKGTSLDLQRAPNRGPSGLRIPGVASFIWESSDGRSLMHSVNVRLRKRMSQGFAAGFSYTFSKSMDDASSIGGGSVLVAQDDQNLDAEWGLSSFDQRHRLSADYTIQLPFGPGRRWLTREGLLQHLVGGWVWNGTLTVSSGTPLTARLVATATDAAQGAYGALRANYDGSDVTLAHPTILQFFNTAAFSLPAAGTFGNAGRNTITGPSSTNLNMSLQKSFSLGGSRTLAVRVDANNVLNMAQFGSVDAVVNSPTFGQVTSMRTMRSVRLNARVGF